MQEERERTNTQLNHDRAVVLSRTRRGEQKNGEQGKWISIIVRQKPEIIQSVFPSPKKEKKNNRNISDGHCSDLAS